MPLFDFAIGAATALCLAAWWRAYQAYRAAKYFAALAEGEGRVAE